jgi:hypothetical protein
MCTDKKMKIYLAVNRVCAHDVQLQNPGDLISPVRPAQRTTEHVDQTSLPDWQTDQLKHSTARTFLISQHLYDQPRNGIPC